jgi:hypothetical protein
MSSVTGAAGGAAATRARGGFQPAGADRFMAETEGPAFDPRPSQSALV